MKAMIFAAGMGTRLQPYTSGRPKALVEVDGIPLIRRIIEKLIGYGYNEMIINVHHFAGQVIRYLEENDYFGIRIAVSDETDQLLDTGGGIKKASWFFEDGKDFLVHNVDVLSDLDLKTMMNAHQSNSALATLAVRSRKSGRYLLFDEHNNLSGWKNVKTGETIVVRQQLQLKELAFSGIHIINPDIFELIKETGKFSIIRVYLALAKTEPIMGFNHDDSYWFDVGKPDQLLQAENFLRNLSISH